MTKEAIMKKLIPPCKAWDYALPHHWCMDVKAKTGIWPAPHFVWIYEDGFMGGRPFAISKIGAMLLYIYTAQGGFA
jgi:hypothetical protein